MTVLKEMTGNELLKSEGNLQQLSAMDLDKKLAYAVARNVQFIERQKKALLRSLQVDDDEKASQWRQFQRDRGRILNNPDREARAKNLMELELKNSKIMDFFAEENNKADEILEEPVEGGVTVYDMRWSLFPETFKAAVLGPMVMAVVGYEEEEDGNDSSKKGKKKKKEKKKDA